MKLLNRVRLFETPWTIAYQAPPSMGFSRQEYWSGLPFPSPGDLPDPGIEPGSPAFQADALTSEPPVGSSSQLFSWLRFKKEEHSFCDTVKYMVALVAQVLKNLSATWEIWVQCLGWEDPLGWEDLLQHSCLENPKDRGDW